MRIHASRAPLLALCMWFACSGCYVSRSAINPPLDPARFSRLQPGVTTAKEAVALLGAPSEVVQLGRRSAYRYEHVVTKQSGIFLIVLVVVGTDAQADRAWLFFDESDVLTHFGTTFEAVETEYGLPNVFVDEDEAPESAEANP